MGLRRFVFLLPVLVIGLSVLVGSVGKPFTESVTAKESSRQDMPLTLAQILTGLQTQGKTPETRTLAARNKFIVNRVRQRGIEFELNKDREQDLRAAGANDELINVIREISEAQAKPKREAEAIRLFNLGNHYLFEKKDNDEAIKLYNKAAELMPDFDVYNNRGIAYGRKGDNDQAIKDYTKAIELVPRHVFAYHNRGNLYADQGNYDRAIKDYTKLIELDPIGGHYWLRGNAYLNKGDSDEAIRDYSKVIEKDPNSVLAYGNRGLAYFVKGDNAQAIKDYTKAIELNPNNFDAYNNRAEAYDKIGEKARAEADRRKYAELTKKP